jgi:osmoprotectant transport system permease protein
MPTRARVLLVVVVVAVVAAVLVLGRRSQPEGAIRAAFDAEFLTRPDGYPGLSECYGFAFRREPMQMDPGLMYRAVAGGAVDVIDGFATDGRIPAYGLAVLEDDRGFFPPYYAAPLVRSEVLDEHPEIEEVLSRLAGGIPDETMQRLNYRVDEQGEKAADVARGFLVSRGLLAEGASPGSGDAGKVVIGSKHFTEQELLGEMMAALIECATDVSVVRKLNLGGTMICFNALEAGDLDLYAEYTGTGLVNILKRDVIADPDEAYAAVKQAFGDEYGLVWLGPFGFNNTYTLTMREDHSRELGIETISDLATHVRSKGGQG